ncbi:hypothetical protein NPIL_474171 [Nephila pilipes]|uniref:Uncharacterized protein n=1 Tax=Nephila pilipes TaxID=299642 RepID=A0A8X6QSA3_NEPPI|nr:hypothetical protein NPIL_114161 [Nephila pilipes]GFT82936.1 hypothetical protein NPIL_474251 [Nephila pilipes]GFU35068.1 hypothetical protein NPIL_413851 [Nephila pilipes]GFU42564.1 hypothetical protein NPIL_474171 [Nephila pilipes]
MSPVFLWSHSPDLGDSILNKGTLSIFLLIQVITVVESLQKTDFLKWDLTGNRRGKMSSDCGSQQSNLAIVVFFCPVGKTLDLAHNNCTFDTFTHIKL